MKIYGLITLVSFLIRYFALPNPFECFGNNAFLINLFVEPIIHALAFGLVGLVYSRGESPALGSFLYIVAYAAIVGLLALLGIFSFAWWWILTLIAVVIAITLLGKFVVNKLTTA